MDYNTLKKQNNLISTYLEKYQHNNDINDLILLVRTAQFAATDYRRLLTEAIMDVPNDHVTSESIEDSVLLEGYSYCLNNGITTIKIPLILPKLKDEKKLSTNFIKEPLDELLRKNSVASNRYEECTIIFEYCYSKSSSNVNSRIRDSDNLEVTAIINIIDRHLLVTDNLVSIVQQTSICSEPDHTKIHILPGKIKTVITGKGALYNVDK